MRTRTKNGRVFYQVLHLRAGVAVVAAAVVVVVVVVAVVAVLAERTPATLLCRGTLSRIRLQVNMSPSFSVLQSFL